MLSGQLHSPGRRSLIYWRMPPASLTPFGRLLKFTSLFERGGRRPLIYELDSENVAKRIERSEGVKPVW